MKKRTPAHPARVRRARRWRLAMAWALDGAVLVARVTGIIYLSYLRAPH